MAKIEHGRRFVADYLKIPEVARRLDVSEKTARRYIKAGTLPSTFIGGAYRVTVEDLETFLHGAEVKPENASPKVPGRSSPEPTLFSELEDERRSAFVQSCRRHAEERAEHYERRLAEAQEGGVFAGHDGARVLFEDAYLEYDDLRTLFLYLSLSLAEGLSANETSRFSARVAAALIPFGKTVDRVADRAAELAQTEAQKAEVERRREQMRRSA